MSSPTVIVRDADRDIEVTVLDLYEEPGSGELDVSIGTIIVRAGSERSFRIGHTRAVLIAEAGSEFTEFLFGDDEVD